KNQQGKAVAENLADVAKCLARARFSLRQRKRVEHQRREIVVETVGEPRESAVLLREEVRLEEFLGHRDGHAIAKPRREGRQDHRRIHVTLMIRRENHRSVDAAQTMASLDTNPSEDARERKEPGWQADSTHGSRDA